MLLTFNIFIVDFYPACTGVIAEMTELITAPGSVSNEPGSVTWLATKYLKNPCSQLEKSHWKINYIVTTEYINLA